MPMNFADIFNTMAKWITPERSKKPDTAKMPLHSDDLPDLPGIDIKKGLEIVGVGLPFYLKMLVRFRDSYKDFEQMFREAQTDSNPEATKILTHTFKGVAGTFAACDLYEAVKSLEIACRDDDNIDDRLADVLKHSETVMTGLENLEVPEE